MWTGKKGKCRANTGKARTMAIKRVMLAILAGAISLVLITVGAFSLWWYGSPVIAVDYVAEFDAMRKPANYRPEDDGAELFIKACRMVTERPEVTAGMRLPWDADANDARRAAMREWIDDNQEAMRLADEAMRKPYCWFKGETAENFESICAPGALDAPRLYRVMLWRGLMKAYDGDAKGGINDIIMAGNMGKCFGPRPTWLEWDIGAGWAARTCDILADTLMHSHLPADDLATLARDIEQMVGQWDPIEWPLALRKLEFQRMVQMTFADDGRGDGRIIPAKAAKLWWHGCGHVSWIENVMTVAGIAGCHPGRKATIECYDKVAAQYQGQWKELYRKTSFSQDKHAVNTESCKNVRLVEDIFPGYHYGFHTPQLRWDYASRAMATIAAMRYKAATGQLPDSLADVVKAGYLAEIPRAWHSGEEFIYEKNGDSFLIYTSVAEKEHEQENVTAEK